MIKDGTLPGFSLLLTKSKATSNYSDVNLQSELVNLLRKDKEITLPIIFI